MTPATLTLNMSKTRFNMSAGVYLISRLMFFFSLSIVGGLGCAIVENGIFGSYCFEDDDG